MMAKHPDGLRPPSLTLRRTSPIPRQQNGDTTLMRHLLLPAICLLVSPAAAQSSLLFTIDESGGRPVLGPDALHQAAGELTDDEVGIVTPDPASFYGARSFLSASTQWAMVGDHDGDLNFFESASSAPGSDVDAIMVNRLLPAPTGGYGPRDVFVSKSSDFAPLWVEGDVFRFSAQGTVEKFVTEAEIVAAIGQAPGSSIDVDAMCNDAGGNLYLSFDATEDINGTSALDGSLVYIPILALTLDANANITAIAPGSAQVIATEADVTAWIQNSGVMDAQGTVPPTTGTDVELSALEIDPAGGTWTSSVEPSLTLPNLLFSWDDTETDGAILSTANGGSIGMLNGAPLASASATTGLQLGLVPGTSGTDGVMGLAVIDAQSHPLQLESWPAISYGATTAAVVRQELTGATPNGPIAFLVSFPVGSGFPSVALPPPFGGELFGSSSTQVAVGTADSNGLAALELILPPGVIGSGLAVVWQAADATTLTLSWPGATDF